MIAQNIFVGIFFGIASAAGIPQISLKDDQQVDAGINAGCYNITEMDGFDIEKFMNSSWLEIKQTSNTFESECEAIQYQYQADSFLMKFGENNPALSFVGSKKENLTIVNFSDGMYSHVVVDTDYTSYAILYTCEQNLRQDESPQELVWVLSRSDDKSRARKVVKTVEDILGDHGHLQDLLDGGKVCTESGPNETTAVETTTLAVETTSAAKPTSDSTEENPPESEGPSSTVPPDFPHGFSIPNCNSTFYFLRELFHSV